MVPQGSLRSRSALQMPQQATGHSANSMHQFEIEGKSHTAPTLSAGPPRPLHEIVGRGEENFLLFALPLVPEVELLSHTHGA
jgi:hypothetical protein